MTQFPTLSKTYTILFLVSTALYFTIQITILALMVSFSYTGFDSANPITVNLVTCTYLQYHGIKFSDLSTFHQLIFIDCVISAALSLALLLIQIYLLMKICKKSEGQSFIPPVCLFCFLYIAASLLIMGAIIQFGYFLTYIAELSNCTNVSNSTQLLIFTLLSAFLLALALLLWFLLFCYMIPKSQQKYQQAQMNSYVTEQDRKPSPNRQRVQRVPKFEQTNQNIVSPQKKPVESLYSKQVENELKQEIRYLSPPDNKKSMSPEKPMQEQSPYSLTPHTISNPVNKYELSPVRQREPENIYAKPRSNIYRKDKDHESLNKQQRKYLNSRQPTILTNGVSEKQVQNNNRSGQFPARSNQNRSGMLINYIRGKYPV